MTGKEIVEAFCYYQGYGEWTMNQKELILAIDDNIAECKKEIDSFKQELKFATETATAYQTEIKYLRKLISEINKAYEGHDF